MMMPFMSPGRGGMPDPFGSMQNMFGQMRQFSANPAQFLMQRKLNIPQQMMNNPSQAIQYLMDSGAMTQSQYNSLQQMAQQIQANPQFQQMIK